MLPWTREYGTCTWLEALQGHAGVPYRCNQCRSALPNISISCAAQGLFWYVCMRTGNIM
jgi:hypothetical protein